MAGHTQGKWVFNQRGQRVYGGVTEGVHIAQVPINPDWVANGRLIASAPDLLGVAKQTAEAIQHVREMGGRWSEDQRQAFLNGVEDSARKAFAKATGQ